MSGWILNTVVNAQFKENSRKIQRCMSGDITSGVLITEFDTGSDWHAVNANAVLNEDVYIITSAKTFITSGQLVDLLTVVTKKDLAAGAKGTILFLVEVGTLSFEKGMKLKKLVSRLKIPQIYYFNNVMMLLEYLLG